MSYVLFSTEACHLCELAQQVIIDVAANQAVDVYIEDISESETLVERYGNRIPVLKDEVNGRELDWPFTHSELSAWLEAC
ncbi:glutaredoxin family protein [Bacterioplanoides sp.]|uniref:glutaredoxin family protein n=1 Tax=Bacterioplanoides sp. TaxID=2066072 RepID=UPI003B00F580